MTPFEETTPDAELNCDTCIHVHASLQDEPCTSCKIVRGGEWTNYEPGDEW